MTTRAEIESRVEVMQAWLDGKDIQHRPAGDVGPFSWRNFDCDGVPRFNFAISEYRIRPAEPDYIDWTHVAPRFKFMARDKDGYVALYHCMPHVSGDEFVESSLHEIVSASSLSSLRIGDSDWKYSLVRRPEVV